jgi:hypothetical protein
MAGSSAVQADGWGSLGAGMVLKKLSAGRARGRSEPAAAASTTSAAASRARTFAAGVAATDSTGSGSCIEASSGVSSSGASLRRALERRPPRRSSAAPAAAAFFCPFAILWQVVLASRWACVRGCMVCAPCVAGVGCVRRSGFPPIRGGVVVRVARTPARVCYLRACCAWVRKCGSCAGQIAGSSNCASAGGVPAIQQDAPQITAIHQRCDTPLSRAHR